MEENIEDICKKCGKCCFDTEMIITIEEIKSINKYLKNKFKTSNFSFYRLEKDNLFYLKNKKNKCVFLTKKKNNYECKIYEMRPFGCRSYPMIYDLDIKKCKIDKFCPHYDKFYVNEKKFKLSCIKLTQFIQNLFETKIL